MPPRRRGLARPRSDPATTAAPYPLYGATHALYRVSPLHNGTAPLTASLPIHARRLRDAVAGDALRGVPLSSNPAEAGSQQDNAGSWGAFRGCTMRLLGSEAAWARARAAAEDADSDADEISGVEDDVPAAEAVGVLIELAFERATHGAILLGDAAGKSRVPGFTCLPLLLVRMPAALRAVLLRFLGTAFDARVAPMKLRRRFLARALDVVIERRLAETQSGTLVDAGAFPRGLQLQLAFPSAAPMLKSIDVDLNQADLSELVEHGRKLWERRSSNRIDRDSESPITGPFTLALAEYLSRHLALNFEHAAVVLSKCSLGPFAFAGDGKVKIMESSPEAQEIWKLVLEESAVTLLKTTLPLPTSDGKGQTPNATLDTVNPRTPSPTRLNAFHELDPATVDELT
jgi:hypothetical protein